MGGVRLILDWAAIRGLMTTPDATRAAMDAGNQFAATAKGFAPHATGAGAASISPQPTDGEADVSWDQAHHYMSFHQTGTKIMPAQPFMTMALDQYAVF